MRVRSSKKIRTALEFVPTKRELDWLDREVEGRLAELDSMFGLSESEWLACEKRLRSRGLEVIRKRRIGDGKWYRSFRERGQLSSELDEVDSESWDGSFCFFCGSPCGGRGGGD